MPRFFCDPPVNGTILITGEDAEHIGKALRMKTGEELTACCTDGTDCDCVIESITREEVLLRVMDSRPNESEPNVRITLYQAMPKGDKMDLIVQKAVELGAAEIVPVLTKRCISRPDAKSMDKKRKRLQKIALEAAKQSGRGIIPQVGQLLSFSEAVNDTTRHEKALLCYEKGGVRLNQTVDSNTKSIGIFIGSEGGFEEEEVLFANQHGVKSVTLGKLILRCETAPLAALAVLMNLTENI